MNQQSDNSNLPRTAGFPDRSFGDDGAISIGGRGTANAIASDKDGNLYVAYAIDNKMRLARYLVDGARDESSRKRPGNMINTMKRALRAFCWKKAAEKSS